MGIPTELFLNEPSEDIVCGICHDVMEDPIITKCEHDFCRECAGEIIEATGLCPMCRAEVTKDDVIASRALRNLISGMKIRCQFSEEGCDKEMRVDEIEAHNKTCSKPCPNGCGEDIPRLNVSSHLITCSKVPQPCEIDGCSFRALEDDTSAWEDHKTSAGATHIELLQKVQKDIIETTLDLDFAARTCQGNEWLVHDYCNSIIFVIPGIREIRDSGTIYFTRPAKFYRREPAEQHRFRLKIIGRDAGKGGLGIGFVPLPSGSPCSAIQRKIKFSVFNNTGKSRSHTIDPKNGAADQQFFEKNVCPAEDNSTARGFAGFLDVKNLEEEWDTWVHDDRLLVKITLLS